MRRRQFLQGCAFAAALSRVKVGWAATPPSIPLILISLRGGWDALSALVPLEGPDRAVYERSRPTLKVARRACRELDAGRGLHPALEPLRRVPLAVVQAAGLVEDTRSHFDACELMDRGQKTSPMGWLGRYLAGSQRFSAVALGAPCSALLGCRALTLYSLEDLDVDVPEGLESWYAGPGWLQAAGRDALEAARTITRAAGPRGDFPETELGESLAQAARVLKLGLGVRVVTVEREGWDTHESQAEVLEELLAELSEALLALVRELGTLPYRIVVQSEFGRKLRENANQGTDHGRGGLTLALGTGVRPGLFGPWPGLVEGEDLAVATDYRQVLLEALPGATFPDYSAGPGLAIFKNGISGINV